MCINCKHLMCNRYNCMIHLYSNVTLKGCLTLECGMWVLFIIFPHYDKKKTFNWISIVPWWGGGVGFQCTSTSWMTLEEALFTKIFSSSQELPHRIRLVVSSERMPSFNDERDKWCHHNFHVNMHECYPNGKVVGILSRRLSHIL